MYHGKMTMLACIECENIRIVNVNADYVRPTVSEMTVEVSGPSFLEVLVHPDSRYVIEDGKLFWTGEGWRHRDGPAQLFDPAANRTWRVPNPVAAAARAEERGPGRLRLHYDGLSVPAAQAGQVFQMRDGIRDQVGAFLCRSRNIVWKNVGMHFMHGLGIVGQFCENLLFERLTLAPRPETGRTVAAFADFLHFSGCRGKISVVNGHFEGAHDDAMNVHGTYLRIVGRPSPNRLRVRFMHGQSFGFAAFFPGDEIDLVNSRTLAVHGSGKIEEVEEIDPRELLLTLSDPVPDSALAGDVVENATWTPEVDVRGNRFARIPTRGLLLTTRRKAVIEDNLFERTAMSGILIANDAQSWYESGRVADVRIRGNRFIECGEPVIGILPENEEADADRPVHANISIESNVFEIRGGIVLQARSASGIRFCGNRLIDASDAKGGISPSSPVRLTACSEVVAEENYLNGRELTFDLRLPFHRAVCPKKSSS
jgi:hypothetical protein